MNSKEDLEFAQMAVNRLLVGKEVADECLRLQALETNPRPLSEIMVDKGHLKPSDVVSILMDLRRQEGPSRIGPFKIVSKLGMGGMGTVYRAKHAKDGTEAALKVIQSQLMNEPELVARFKREAEVGRQLSHPNIVRTHAVGQDGDYHYLAMEFVEGEDLSKVIAREGILEECRALEIVRDVALGLEHAHTMGLVHRDVKPANILITKEGKVKVSDFGLAKITDSQITQLTRPGWGALGTPHFISPEQAKGERVIDHRADIYSLGATLYKMVTGKTPFEGDSPLTVINKHISEDLQPPDEVNPELSNGCVAIIEKMMAKDKEDRYQAPENVVEDINEVLDGKPPIFANLTAGRSSVMMSAKRFAEFQRRMKERGGDKGIKKSTVAKSLSSTQHRPSRLRYLTLTAIFAVAGCLVAAAVASYVFLEGPKESRLPEPVPGETDRKPAVVLAEPGQLIHSAQTKLAGGDRQGAADDYAAAAEAFDRMGNFSEAERYKQAAYGLRFTTATDEKQHVVPQPEGSPANPELLVPGPPVKENVPPTVLFRDIPRAVVMGGAVLLVAEANDADGEFVEVRFHVNGKLAGEYRSKARVFEHNWFTGNLPEGEYHWRVEVKDDAGELSEASHVITLSPDPHVVAGNKKEKREEKLRDDYKDLCERHNGWRGQDPDEMITKWRDLHKLAVELENDKYAQDALRFMGDWEREKKYRKSAQLARNQRDAFRQDLNLAERIRLADKVYQQATEAEKDAHEEADRNEMATMAEEFGKRVAQYVKDIVCVDAHPRINGRFQEFEKALTEKRFHEAESTLQSLEQEEWDMAKEYKKRDLRAAVLSPSKCSTLDLLPLLRERFAESRIRMCREALAQYQSKKLPKDEEYLHFTPQEERDCRWALGVYKRIGIKDDQVESWRTMLPNLYDVPMPGNAIVGAEFGKLGSTFEDFKRFLANAGWGAFFDRHRILNDLKKRIESAPDSYTKNALVASTDFPVGEHGRMPSGSYAYIAQELDEPMGTNPALGHRLRVIYDTPGMDAHASARNDHTKGIATLRVLEALKKYGDLKIGQEDNKLKQVERVGVRFLISPDIVEVDGRILPFNESELEKDFQDPSTVLDTSTVVPFSDRVILLATFTPSNVAVRYLLRLAFVGPSGIGKEVADKARKEQEEELLRSINMILNACGRQITAGLDCMAEPRTDEFLLLVSKRTKRLDDLFKWAERKKVTEAMQIGKRAEARDLKPESVGPFEINGFEFSYDDRRLRFLIATSSDYVLVALGGDPRPGIDQSIERLQNQKEGIAWLDGFRRRIPRLAGAYLVFRPSQIIGQASDSIMLFGHQDDGLASFNLSLPARSLESLRDGLNEYLEGGRRADTAFAPEWRSFKELLLENWETGETDTTNLVKIPHLPEALPSWFDPVVSALAGAATRNSGSFKEAAQRLLELNQNTPNHVSDRDDRELVNAVGEYAADPKRERAGVILSRLTVIRRKLALDKGTPPWREALYDLFISRLKFDYYSDSNHAKRYVEGCDSILKEAYGDPDSKRGHAIDRLAAVMLAWKAVVVYFPGRERSQDDRNLLVRAKSLLENENFGQGIWLKYRKLKSVLEDLE